MCGGGGGGMCVCSQICCTVKKERPELSDRQVIVNHRWPSVTETRCMFTDKTRKWCGGEDQHDVNGTVICPPVIAPFNYY